MITQCHFCDYHKIESIDLDLLQKSVDGMNAGIDEDMLTFIGMMVEKAGFKGWNSVKIHMGMKHKDSVYRGIWPNLVFEPAEQKIVDQLKAIE